MIVGRRFTKASTEAIVMLFPWILTTRELGGDWHRFVEGVPNGVGFRSKDFGQTIHVYEFDIILSTRENMSAIFPNEPNFLQ
jgi:hypothetical protein